VLYRIGAMATEVERRGPADAEAEFSPFRDDVLFRIQRAIGLIPAQGLGVGRRAVFWALVTWLPIAVWAVLTGRALPGSAAEPLMQHYGVHVRCLLAIPIMIIGEAVAHGVALRVIPYFVRSGLVTNTEQPRFVAILRETRRWRDAWRPWVIIAGILAAWTFASPPERDVHELLWAADDPSSRLHLGFGGWWFVYVTRPVFLALILMWLWRLLLVIILMWRVSRLDLALVPTHPDRAGGLGFLEGLPLAFAPLAFATGAVLASRWGHDVVYHGVHVQSLRLPVAAFAALIAILMLTPLFAFRRPLAALRSRALLDYGSLVAEHGRMVRRRWIFGERLSDDGLLSAPELGPVGDTITLYEAVGRTRPAPIGRQTLVLIALPIALPMVPLFAIEVPVKDILLKVVSTLL
jgi:hypothetical protein